MIAFTTALTLPMPTSPSCGLGTYWISKSLPGSGFIRLISSGFQNQSPGLHRIQPYQDRWRKWWNPWQPERLPTWHSNRPSEDWQKSCQPLEVLINYIKSLYTLTFVCWGNWFCCGWGGGILSPCRVRELEAQWIWLLSKQKKDNPGVPKQRLLLTSKVAPTRITPWQGNTVEGKEWPWDPAKQWEERADVQSVQGDWDVDGDGEGDEGTPVTLRTGPFPWVS